MNRVKKKIKITKRKRGRAAFRVIALLLISALIFSFMPTFTGSAATNYLTTTGPQGEPMKREVVYGKLAADGSSVGVCVVNHYELTEMQNFKDYGDYSKVLQLTGENAPQLDSDQVKLQATAGSYYYQGDLKSNDLPWLIDITYKLDGQKITAAEAAGSSGELFIKITSKANPAVDSFFFDHYALQVSATLNPDKARLLETDDSATIAIEGQDRTVSWIVFPGQEADLSLKLQVNDFEMTAMTFAGISLNFDFDFDLDDFSDDTAALGELSDGIKELANGAEELEDAVAQLQEGFTEIESGSSTLKENGSGLSQGAGDLKSGSVQLEQGVKEYTGGVSSLSQGMNGLASGLVQLRAGVAQLAGNGNSLSGGSNEILSGLQQILQGLPDDEAMEDISFDLPTEEELAELDELVQGSEAFKAGLDELAQGAAGINELYQGMESLKNNLANLGAEVGEIPLLDPNTPIRDNEAWTTYLAELDVSPEAQNKLIPELTYLSTMAKTYSTALQGLQIAFSELNNPTTGVPALVAGMEQLLPLAGGLGKLAENYGDIHNGLVFLVNQLKELAAMEGNLPELLAGLSDLETGMNTLVSEYEKFDTGLSEYTQGVSQLLPVFDGTSQQPGLIAGANQLQAGLKQLNNESASLTGGLSGFSAGVAEYKQGVDSYVGGVSSLDNGLNEFRSEGLDEFANGFGQYAEGVFELRDATANLQDDFMEQLEQAITEYTDTDFEPRSFVSDKNSNVIDVQFVLMTEGISKPDENNGSTFEPEIEGDFFSRLKSLFVKEDE